MSDANHSSILDVPAFTVKIGLVLTAVVMASVGGFWYSESHKDLFGFASTAVTAAGQLALALYTLRLLRLTAASQVASAASGAAQTTALERQTSGLQQAIAALEARGEQHVSVLSRQCEALEKYMINQTEQNKKRAAL